MKRSWLLRLIRIPLFCYVGIVLALMLLERSLVFLPTRYPGGDWQAKPAAAEDVFFQAADGTRLHGWLAVHDEPTAVVLYAHGNAGNITHRSDTLQRLHHDLGCTVLMFDYRGYGKSEGRPSEQGVLLDGQAASDLLARRAGVARSDLLLMGRSLGTAVAVDLAARDGARGLVLYSGFPSLPEVAARHYPWVPVRWLMRTRMNSLAKIQNYHGPLLQAHAAADEIITEELGRQLFEAAPMDQKTWFTLGNSTHNDPPPETFYVAVRQFIAATAKAAPEDATAAVEPPRD